jgi:molecular chaperone Hsp33
MDAFETAHDIKLSGDDHVIPFQVEGLDVRGRAVQLGPMLDQILTRHTYPEPVAQLLAEGIVLTVLLGTSLKFEGRLILQTKGDGPVELLVVDFRAPASVRAYAQFDQEKLDQAIKDGSSQPHQLLGKGVLAFTIDQGANKQIPTSIKLSVAELIAKDEDGKTEHQWRAGGILIQFLPHASDRMSQADLPGGDLPDGVEEETADEDDAWTEAKVLVETVSASELTDPQVGSERLLYRLFHERGVRIFEAGSVRDECSCSRDHLFGVLSRMDKEELVDTFTDGKIEIACEFCSTQHKFTQSEFDL